MRKNIKPSTRFVTGLSVADSKTSTESIYDTISFEEICDLANKPADVAKDDAAWFIPSTYNQYDARKSESQRANGEFGCLVLDIDDGNHDLEEIEAALKASLGAFSGLIYSTFSSKSDDKRWRIIVRLAELLQGRDYHDTVLALIDVLAKATNGTIQADLSSAKPSQLSFLPNIGVAGYYECKCLESDPLVLDDDHLLIVLREKKRAEKPSLSRRAAVHFKSENPDVGYVQELLSYIDPSLGYDRWLRVLMGLHHYFSGSLTGLAIAEGWSLQSPKFKPGEVRRKWESFS